MSRKLSLPSLKELKNSMRHNPLNTKQTEHQGPQLRSSNEVEDDPPTPHTSYTYSTSQAPLRLLQRLSVVKILPNEADQEKKATLGGTFDCHIILHGKETRVGG